MQLPPCFTVSMVIFDVLFCAKQIHLGLKIGIAFAIGFIGP